MSMDIIVSETGHVMIVSSHAFEDEVIRVDLHPRQRLLQLSYKRQAPAPDGDILNIEVHDDMLNALLAAPSVLLVHVHRGHLVAGFDVPLVQSDFELDAPDAIRA